MLALEWNALWMRSSKKNRTEISGRPRWCWSELHRGCVQVKRTEQNSQGGRAGTGVE